MEPSTNKTTVVLLPCIGLTRLIHMVELAKFFLRSGLDVVVAVPTPPSSAADCFTRTISDADRFAAAHPDIFHRLPPPDYRKPKPDTTMQMFDTMRLSVTSLVDFLLYGRTSFAALVLDLFCFDALYAASMIGIPVYFYYNSSAGELAALLHLPHYFATKRGSLKDRGRALLRFPGVPPIPASDMPPIVLNRMNRTCQTRIGHYRRIPETQGILINTTPTNRWGRGR
ncbi:hypothetical protein E2562_031538 [Oryza meyeriana var. granulata]|uniref:Uncharacterized protein n=1 Tax=Oryza meyeriana var. granulata TaxID=110450 RepID=A0A6G1FEH7_9ORYZ|nr:hypothetical protein E2562_031483 [Oryza meyeriana var. granulata]KAF0935244.1 hypothetical protein E2562_031538 [Oryza meyeriana var. granulata]